MIRALILLTLSGVLLVGCNKFGSKYDPQEEVNHVMRLAQAPVATTVRRQNIWHNTGRKLAECGLRLGVDVTRRGCGVASADARWSVA